MLANVIIGSEAAVGGYHHLTICERERVMCMREQGKSIGEVARALGRSRSTVSRELRRNGGGAYSAASAQRGYEERRRACRRRRRLDDPATRAYVQARVLEDRWSPEQVEGRLRLEGSPMLVSRSTIYRAVRRGDLDTPELARTRKGAASRLRHRGKRRLRRKDGEVERRGKIAISHPIEDRPAGAADRSEPGHWESDTVAGREGGACLVTHVDRRSRLLAGGKADSKTSAEVNRVTVAALAGQPLASLTPDRGKEFARHAEVTDELGVEFYFPLPHHPWDRGTNENTNGLLREFFPKRTDLDAVTDEEVQKVYDMLNRRPRKCLGYLTPYEVHYSAVLHLV